MGYDKDVISEDKNLIPFKSNKELIEFVVYLSQTYTS